MVSSSRSHFDRELALLVERVLHLGSLASGAVRQALSLLGGGSVDAAREVIQADAAINRTRFEIEKDCYGLLATEQPVARDMRIIVSALTVANDLERIADHGKKIAAIHIRMATVPRTIPMADIQLLGEMGLAMLDRALRCYASCDVAEAEALCAADDQVDALYKQTVNIILSYMLENPRLIGAGTYLVQIAHELERVADRATNIAERVIYAATGELVDLNV